MTLCLCLYEYIKLYMFAGTRTEARRESQSLQCRGKEVTVILNIHQCLERGLMDRPSIFSFVIEILIYCICRYLTQINKQYVGIQKMHATFALY